MNGSGTRKSEIEGFRPADTEDLTLGPCGESKTCLFVADIGDNRESRTSIRIAVIEETQPLPAKVKPLRVIQIQYPDRPHNAEALGIHPNGDLLIVTKEMKSSEAKPAHIFRLKKQDLERPGSEVRRLEAWGMIDVLAIVASKGYEGLVTSMSIAPAGDRFLLLTYEKALEMAWDFARPLPLPISQRLKTSGQVSVVPIRRLYQQEAISYHKNGRDFLYDTEAPGIMGPGPKQAELIALACLKRSP